MTKFNIGDRVMVLDDNLNGTIKNISLQGITIETEDGFEITYEADELVLDQQQNPIHSFLSKAQIQKAHLEKEPQEKPKWDGLLKTKKNEVVLEVDLHIEKLIPHWKRLDNYEILNIQLDTAQRQLDFALSKRIPKVVFIHGVGEGVLKSELHYLFKRYEGLQIQEADYQKYGQGATEIYFIQKKL
ncbi:Smr/MutS family protein [Flavobacterium sp.]|uniref:Smr/MutS family protein n=1 Tax=Flavobacterium sp. TaxID=239 RepID=UPI002FD94C4A